MSLWHKVKGAAAWIGCTRAPRTVTLRQFQTCLGCPSAVVGQPLADSGITIPCYVLSCGPAGVESHDPPRCGCVVGWVGPLAWRRIRQIASADERRRVALAAMRPAGKTRCVTQCPQMKW